MSKPLTYLIVGIVGLCVLGATGPTLVALFGAAVPLIAAAGVAAIAVRLVFFHTRK